jgi:hypothetical protein
MLIVPDLLLVKSDVARENRRSENYVRRSAQLQFPRDKVARQAMDIYLGKIRRSWQFPTSRDARWVLFAFDPILAIIINNGHDS